MYHYVHDEVGPRLPWHLDLARGLKALSPVEFEHQLDELQRELTPLDWPTLFRALRGEEFVPNDSFLLTFDDGLANHIRFVLPILERRGLRGIFFVPTAVLRGDTILAAHAVHLLLAALGDDRFADACRSAARRAGLTVVEPPTSNAVSPAYAYEAPRRAAWKQWIHFQLPPTARNAILDDLMRRHLGDPGDWARSWYLSPDEVLAMQAAGHTVGGHGHSHEALAAQSPDAQAADLARCSMELTRLLGPGERPLSYPFGSVSNETRIAAQRAGFVAAFTTQAGTIELPHGSTATGRDGAFAELSLPRIDTIHVGATLSRIPRHEETSRCA